MKKTRLLEIIREEIAFALSETTQLNERPNIDGPLDFTLKSPNKPITPDNINQGALQKAIDSAVEAIKKEYPEYDSNKLSNLIMKVNGKKELKADSFSPEILKALKNVKDTIQQQYDVFGDYPEAKSKLTQFIKDYKTQINPAAKDQLEKFASGDKKFTDVMGYNQTETATEKSLGIKPKKAADIIPTGSSTDKQSTQPKAEKPAKEEKPKAERPKKEKPEPKPKEKEEGDEEIDDSAYYKSEEEFGTTEKEPSSKDVKGDPTAKKLGTKKEKLAQLQKELNSISDTLEKGKEKTLEISKKIKAKEKIDEKERAHLDKMKDLTSKKKEIEAVLDKSLKQL